MDNKQKQELNEVLKKYKRAKGDVAKGYLRGLTKGAIFGVALDAVFTGGFGTLAALTAASLPTLKALRRTAVRSGLLQADKRPQRIQASPDVQIVLMQQQVTLAVAFNEAVSKKPIDPAHTAEKKFFDTAGMIEEEVRKLRPAIKVISGGEKRYGTDEYQIMVSRLGQYRRDAAWDILTLEEARAELHKKIAAEDAQLTLEATLKPANDIRPQVKKHGTAGKRPGFNI